jgi:hypothetical protein
VLAFSRTLTRADRFSGSWINFSTRAIKMTVFVLSSSILWRNRAALDIETWDNTHAGYPADWPPMRIRLHKRPMPGALRRDV